MSGPNSNTPGAAPVPAPTPSGISANHYAAELCDKIFPQQVLHCKKGDTDCEKGSSQCKYGADYAMCKLNMGFTPEQVVADSTVWSCADLPATSTDPCDPKPGPNAPVRLEKCTTPYRYGAYMTLMFDKPPDTPHCKAPVYDEKGDMTLVNIPCLLSCDSVFNDSGSASRCLQVAKQVYHNNYQPVGYVDPLGNRTIKGTCNSTVHDDSVDWMYNCAYEQTKDKCYPQMFGAVVANAQSALLANIQHRELYPTNNQPIRHLIDCQDYDTMPGTKLHGKTPYFDVPTPQFPYGNVYASQQ